MTEHATDINERHETRVIIPGKTMNPICFLEIPLFVIIDISINDLYSNAYNTAIFYVKHSYKYLWDSACYKIEAH